jgi:hypothetical protein
MRTLSTSEHTNRQAPNTSSVAADNAKHLDKPWELVRIVVHIGNKRPPLLDDVTEQRGPDLNVFVVDSDSSWHDLPGWQ